MKFGRMSVIAIMVALLFTAGMVAATTAQAATRTDAQAVVDKAKLTFNDFMHDKKFTWFHEHLKDAKGLLIFPDVFKAGFIVGGSGGKGVLVVKDEKTCNWTDPAFYTIGSASLGLQIGAQSAEVIVMVMNQHAVDALLASSLKFGAGASFAAGPVGEGAGTNVMADFITFSKAKGVYAGISLKGSVVHVSDTLNGAYYGRHVRPPDILVKRDVSNKGAADFLAVVRMSTMGKEGRCSS